MDLTIWNILLSFGLGLIGWLARNLMAEQQRISILLNRTREEIAKEYVTKQEAKYDITRVLDRLETLDHKLDRLPVCRHMHPKKMVRKLQNRGPVNIRLTRPKKKRVALKLGFSRIVGVAHLYFPPAHPLLYLIYCTALRLDMGRIPRMILF